MAISAMAAQSELRERIGQNIVLARALVDPPMSQNDLIRAIERLVEKGERPFTRSMLSQWENGHVRPNDLALSRIGLATGRSLGWFYEPHNDE